MVKKILVITGFIVVSAASAVFLFTNNGSAPQQQPAQPQVKDNSTNNTTAPKDDKFNTSQYSLTEPSSIWFIANKHFSLPTSYVPEDLITPSVQLRLNGSEEQMKIRKIAETDLIALFEAGKQAGLQLEFGSGYRSAAYQKILYSGYVASMGQAEADKSSARPGHSEHQTGLALDFTRIDGSCHLDECFGTLPEGKWLAENAHTYGFILRYPKDKESVTGYMYEPWHYRYVGRELSNEYNKQNTKTLEEFFSLEAAPNYL